MCPWGGETDRLRIQIITCTVHRLLYFIRQTADSSSTSTDGSRHWLSCSLLGGLLIILGLYAFLWGKGKEMQEQRKQISAAAANTERSKGSGAADGNGVDSVQVGKQEVRIRVEGS